MGLLDKFKEKLTGVRKAVEEWKANNPRWSKLISAAIGTLPEPFNTFGNVIWEGLEKEDDGPQKMLEILERIEKTNPKQFGEISSKIDELIEMQASHEDIQDIGKQIIESKEKIISILSSKLDKLTEISKDSNERIRKIENQLAEMKRARKEDRKEFQRSKEELKKEFQKGWNALTEYFESKGMQEKMPTPTIKKGGKKKNE